MHGKLPGREQQSVGKAFNSPATPGVLALRTHAGDGDLSSQLPKDHHGSQGEFWSLTDPLQAHSLLGGLERVLH